MIGAIVFTLLILWTARVVYYYYNDHKAELLLQEHAKWLSNLKNFQTKGEKTRNDVPLFVVTGGLGL
jgi:hypothetical protein